MSETVKQFMLMCSDPNMAGILGGALSVFIMQIYKKVCRLPAGTAINEKRVAAILTSAIVTLSMAALQQQWNLADLVTMYMITYLTASGIHNTALRSKESLTPGSSQKLVNPENS